MLRGASSRRRLLAAVGGALAAGPCIACATAARPDAGALSSAAPATSGGPTPALTPLTPVGPTPVVIPTAERGKEDLVLATTTSTQDSGLLDVLVPMFEQRTGYRVKTVSVGTGAALALGARGEADVVLVHAPDAERQWMAQENGLQRLLVMHNDFILIGPFADPAAIRAERSAVAAVQKIAERRAPWISRDDNSGTDQLEKQLWSTAGITPAGQPWYVTSGQGMGATLTLADQKDAYTISDRATYLARKGTMQLVTVLEGDPKLLNVYHVMPVNPAKFPNLPLNVAGGRAFATFMVAPDVQRTIGEFGKDKYGQQLFVPDAGKREEDVGLAP